MSAELDIPGYRLVAEISRGATAIVYRAYQLSLNRAVLVKALKPDVRTDRDLVERFQREAQLCARLAHPNIVAVYDFGESNGSLYIVMEYVEGLSLEDLLNRGRLLPLEIVMGAANGILRALEHAHANGVIHRDVKPANVLISTEGVVKLTDFGLATFTGQPSATSDGTVVGTPAYMSPEQLSGGPVDARSDLFSFGATLFEMLTLRAPFAGKSYAESIQRVLNQRPEPPSRFRHDVPSGLDEVVNALLEKDPRKRPLSAEQVLSALDRIERELGLEADESDLASYLRDPDAYSPSVPIIHVHPPDSEARATAPRVQRRRPWAVAAGGLLAASGILALYLALSNPQGPEMTERAVGDLRVPKESLADTSIPLRHSGEPPLETATNESVRATERVAPTGTTSRSGPSHRFDEPRRLVVVEDQAPFGWLHIICSPWAMVYVDGDSVDTTPLRGPLRLSAGRHHLRLRNPLFRDYVTQVNVRPGRVESLRVSMVPNFGELVVKVHPWAEVFIDGRYCDTTPLGKPLSISAGRHTVMLKNPSFPVWREEVEIIPGKRVELDVDLAARNRD